MRKTAFSSSNLPVIATLSAFFYLSNPYWFGDAPWYAIEISKQPPFLYEAGHMFWRPLGYALWAVLKIISPSIDPITPLLVISSILAAAGCVAVFYLGLRFGMPKSLSLLSAVLFSCSHFCLAYAGSGSDYLPAAALAVLTVMPLIRETGWERKDAFLSAAGGFATLCFWILGAVVLAPQFAAAYWFGRGGRMRRFLNACFICGSSALAFAAMVPLTYWAYALSGGNMTFGVWLHGSAHGIPLSFTLSSVSQAAFGLPITFLHLGYLGTALKGALLRDYGVVPPAQVAFYAFGMTVFLFFFATAAYKAVRRVITKSATHLETGLYFTAGAALFASACTALLWFGADVERYGLSVPFLSLALIHALSVPILARQMLRPVLAFCFAFFVAANNFSFLILPHIITGGMGGELQEAAKSRLPEGSLLVVTGQFFGTNIWAPLMYFNHITVHSVLFDTQMQGVEGWRDRLAASIERALATGGKVAVLSDLVGEPTPGGVGLCLKQYASPSFDEVVEALSQYRKGTEWQVRQFKFIELGR